MNSAETFHNMLATTVAAFEAARNKGGTVFRASSLGKCPRQLAYRELRPDLAKPVHHRLALARIFGTEVHEHLRRIITLDDEEMETVYVMTDSDGLELVIPGHIDGTIMIDGVRHLIEVKSIAERGWDAIAFAEDPYAAIDESYKATHSLYRACLGGMPGIFLFYNKNTSHVFCVQSRDEPALMAKSLGQMLLVYRCVLALRGTGQAPPESLRAYGPIAEEKRKKPTGRQVLPWQCNYCEFVESCWPQARLDTEGSKPIYVV